jgi:hypothetical protein
MYSSTCFHNARRLRAVDTGPGFVGNAGNACCQVSDHRGTVSGMSILIAAVLVSGMSIQVYDASSTGEWHANSSM